MEELQKVLENLKYDYRKNCVHAHYLYQRKCHKLKREDLTQHQYWQRLSIVKIVEKLLLDNDLKLMTLITSYYVKSRNPDLPKPPPLEKVQLVEYVNRVIFDMRNPKIEEQPKLSKVIADTMTVFRNDSYLNEDDGPSRLSNLARQLQNQERSLTFLDKFTR